MTPILPVRCEIADEHVDSAIRYLEIEEGDGGFYLFQYETLDQPPKWDAFYDCLEDVLRDCREKWGIDPKMWTKE